MLRRRLLLVLFGLGTNMGIKRVAATGKHGESEATLRRVRHLFVNRANMRAALRKLVNATFAVRDEMWWGTGAACASGSRKFGAWSSNLMTEWHQRYRGPGVMSTDGVRQLRAVCADDHREGRREEPTAGSCRTGSRSSRRRGRRPGCRPDGGVRGAPDHQLGKHRRTRR